MYLHSLLTILILSILTTATPHHLDFNNHSACPKEPHCALITYDTMKQIELDNTSCTDLKEGTVYGVLVASCKCYVFSNYGCTDNFDTFEQCPGLKGPDFRDGKMVRSVRCEGQ